jgi:hypothetical protein
MMGTCMQSLNAYIFIDFCNEILQDLIYYNFLQKIILKTGFGQAYGKDLVNNILQKFTMYFSELYSIFYVFLNIDQAAAFLC